MLSESAVKILDWVSRLRLQALDDGMYVQCICCSIDDYPHIYGAVFDTKYASTMSVVKEGLLTAKIDGMKFYFSDVLETGRNMVVLAKRVL